MIGFSDVGDVPETHAGEPHLGGEHYLRSRQVVTQILETDRTGRSPDNIRQTTDRILDPELDIQRLWYEARCKWVLRETSLEAANASRNAIEVITGALILSGLLEEQVDYHVMRDLRCWEYDTSTQSLRPPEEVAEEAQARASGSGFVPIINDAPDALEQHPVQTIFGHEGLPGMPPVATTPNLHFRPHETLQQRLGAAQAAAHLSGQQAPTMTTHDGIPLTPAGQIITGQIGPLPGRDAHAFRPPLTVTAPLPEAQTQPRVAIPNAPPSSYQVGQGSPPLGTVQAQQDQRMQEITLPSGPRRASVDYLLQQMEAHQRTHDLPRTAPESLSGWKPPYAWDPNCPSQDYMPAIFTLSLIHI